MWCLSEIVRRNNEHSEKLKKAWRGSYMIDSKEALIDMANYPFPYTTPLSNREVLFACNTMVLSQIDEKKLMPLLGKLWEEHGKYALSLLSTSSQQIRLLIWFG